MSCKGCAYAVCLSGEWYCDYLQIVGHRRPCPPGEGCTVRKEGNLTKKGNAFMKRREWDTEKARALYEQDWSDARIAEEVGTNTAAVARWRKELGLPSLIERRGASPAEAPASVQLGQPASPPPRPLALPPVKGPIELSVELDGRAFALRAPDLEGAAQIYEYAGRLLEEIRRAAGNLREEMDHG